MKITRSTVAALAIACLLPLPACTTATYGLKPAPVATQPDTFVFKIFTGGFSAGGTSDARLAVELDRYKTENGYRSYTILEKQYNLVPSGFEYTVKFSR